MKIVSIGYLLLSVLHSYFISGLFPNEEYSVSPGDSERLSANKTTNQLVKHPSN